MPFGRRTQQIVYWARSSYDAYGEPTVSTPVELTVRWEQGLSQEVQVNTNPTAVDATVWLDPDQEVSIGGMMRLEPLDELPGTADEILEIVEVQIIPDIKGRILERVALLRKYKDSLPTVE